MGAPVDNIVDKPLRKLVGDMVLLGFIDGKTEGRADAIP